MTQSIQMKAFTERASSSETNGQGADKKKQGAMGRHKKTIATSAALVIIMVISVLVTKIAVQHPRSFCPDDWIGFQDKCYHFSEKEGDWESSRGNCSKEHADLTTIDNEKEMSFLLRYKCAFDHWIGLKMKENHTRQWVNGTIFTRGFKVRGSEECAYLDDLGITTARCYADRKWICRKDNVLTW
ncbi:C-type lectin domain family 2 member B isoform X2 [Nycticebus coucang]|uniref:C-type lectin domain family 2 member B isoform X2 n=1 Tax=Nycticebus coucang TaxID=9470 RepID=UPI00234C71F3|nr:C-type lectin domain family 2 member B isoform X2 [Nycticebus coucang]